jgi:hypothetical protein
MSSLTPKVTNYPDWRPMSSPTPKVTNPYPKKKSVMRFTPSEQSAIIYNMGLHTCAQMEDEWGRPLNITRIPGGWLYQQVNPSQGPSAPTFVPFSPEFCPPKPSAAQLIESQPQVS